MADEPWTMPAWMEPYRDLIRNTGGDTVEDLVNDRTTNVMINAPRALLVASVKAQVALLGNLHRQGLLGQLDVSDVYVDLGYMADKLGMPVATLRTYHKRACRNRDKGQLLSADLPAPDAPSWPRGQPRWKVKTANAYVAMKLKSRHSDMHVTVAAEQ